MNPQAIVRWTEKDPDIELKKRNCSKSVLRPWIILVNLESLEAWFCKILVLIMVVEMYSWMSFTFHTVFLIWENSHFKIQPTQYIVSQNWNSPHTIVYRDDTSPTWDFHLEVRKMSEGNTKLHQYFWVSSPSEYQEDCTSPVPWCQVWLWDLFWSRQCEQEPVYASPHFFLWPRQTLKAHVRKVKKAASSQDGGASSSLDAWVAAVSQTSPPHLPPCPMLELWHEEEIHFFLF